MQISRSSDTNFATLRQNSFRKDQRHITQRPDANFLGHQPEVISFRQVEPVSYEKLRVLS